MRPALFLLLLAVARALRVPLEGQDGYLSPMTRASLCSHGKPVVLACLTLLVALAVAQEKGPRVDDAKAISERLGTLRSMPDAERAVALGAECRALLAEHLRTGEALLVPAVTGEPPPLDEGTTGDPLFCRAWTLLGVPALAVPAGTGPRGAPVGVQLVAPAGGDAALVAAGGWAARHLR